MCALTEGHDGECDFGKSVPADCRHRSFDGLTDCPYCVIVKLQACRAAWLEKMCNLIDGNKGIDTPASGAYRACIVDLERALGRYAEDLEQMRRDTEADTIAWLHEGSY